MAGTASVIDGDTLEIHGVRVRLHGIDAPESRQTCERDGKEYRCGQRAALALSDWIGRRPVTCEAKNKDRYGRTVASCSVGGQDIGGWLVSQGHAVAYRRYGGAIYDKQEAGAKAGKRGVWAGTFQQPQEYRQSGAKPPVASPSPAPVVAPARYYVAPATMTASADADASR